ncbi:MAG: phosphotransferase [Candidatus Promineifilaceae bacterium]|nr:phosphotransferase [Candidatus Promineifilaceae bacterium]
MATGSKHSRQLGPPIAYGRTAVVYDWQPGQVVKLFYDWFPQEAIASEARIAAAVQRAGVAAPAVGPRVEVDGRTGLVYEKVQGEPMTTALTSRPWRTDRLARQLADLQAALHARVGPETLPAQHARLQAKIEAAEPLSAELRQAPLRLLAGLPQGDRLCHGDFHPGNVLMAEQGLVFIDWMDASRGHPLADLARSSLLISRGQLPDGTPLRWLIERIRSRFHRVYLDHYRREQPWDEAQFSAWLVVNAAARLTEGVPEAPALLAFVQQKLAG